MIDDSEQDTADGGVRLGLEQVVIIEKDGGVVLDHETLKYHLLGPSLTKAGQDSVDQKKVSEIIYNASKGSKFFNNEEVKDRNLTGKIERILSRKRQLDKLDLKHDLRKADEYIEQLEVSRDLSQHVVHIDCDAFYAAVEELDRPELKDVPMAVGQGESIARPPMLDPYGCRPIARKLKLTILPRCTHNLQLPRPQVRLPQRHGRLRSHETLPTTHLPTPQLPKVHRQSTRSPPSPRRIRSSFRKCQYR